MICIFPDPYPDELLYSICARYTALMHYPNRVTATRDFFGDGVGAAVVDLPNRIGHLIDALPPGHLYSVNELIYNHTHYQFYAPFLPSGRALQVRNAMRDGGDNRVAERIGTSADRLKMPTHLRFCPSCVKEDRANFGETYWHRLHQIPGVEVCPQHAVFLDDSTTLWRNPRNPGEAISAEHSVYETSVRTVDTVDHTQRIQLGIARYALWLLEWVGEIVGSEILRFRYYNLLLKQGLASYGGQIRTSQLIQKFQDYYPNELLKHLGCEIINPYSNWLLRLLHLHKAEVAQHPLRHILLLILIGYSPEDVLGSFVEFKPFGDKPWPCLNYASGHNAELRVLSCQVTDGAKKNKGKPVGTFSCSCGFVYTRTGPDKAEDDRFKWTSIQSYGMEWENLLKQIWNDTSLSLRQVAWKLGVDELTVKRRAISLGLTFPRSTPSSLRSSGEILNRYKIKLKPTQEKQTINRKSLLLLIDDNPHASRTELQVLAPHLMHWLRRWDRDWLEHSLPPAKKRQPPVATVNWEEEDLTLSDAVEKAASHIRSVIGQPRRVSITAIIKIVGHRIWIEKGLDKLPLTSQVLDTHVESFEDYSIRRIAWAAESFCKAGVMPSRTMLSDLAGVRGRMISKIERVQSALDSVLGT
jgi:Tn7-like transposition protein D/TniQ